MAIEAPTLVEDEAFTRPENERYLHWSPIFAGALAAAAFSFILITFGVTVGLGVSSTSPTWRDASSALSLLSGFYLILQAIASFGFGGYVTGSTRTYAASARSEEVENRDGIHGLAAWALAVLIGAALAAIVGAATVSRSSTSATSGNTTAAEPLLSYELDRLLRAPRRAANADLSEERAEAGRILMTSSSHSGVSGDDRTFLVQQVAAVTGVPAADAERRVNQAIADSKTAIAHSRRSTIILAFSLAAATLFGAVSAWAMAVIGGRRRDGAPLPEWMAFADRFGAGAR